MFKFRVPVQANEEVAQNNQRESLIEVYNRREKILYLEGQPRPEPKFIRRATENDDNLQVVLLLAHGRGDRDGAGQVPAPGRRRSGGAAERIPADARGAVRVSRRSSSAASRRRRSRPSSSGCSRTSSTSAAAACSCSAASDRSPKAAGPGTPLADALPVVLDPGVARAAVPAGRARRPADAAPALTHPSTQIADAAEDVAAKWKDLPPLTSLNPLVETKPGANVLLTGTDGRGREQVVFAYQRYGRGKALVLPVQDTWLWRMHSKMDVKDLTHHTFWQRLMRWQVDGVPDRVMASADARPRAEAASRSR